MATPSEAQAVKSLNTAPGRRRFVFKTFSQRVEDIDIDVFRSLQPVQSEPSEGSSFFRDCLVEWRELNTAEEFISFYEEMLPLVQTLPQIILQKELILSKLLSRLKMKGRLSLEPILRMIASLSRDLLEDFLPFLQRIADSLVSLLKSGADRDPEIIEQIFTSWSYIMMYLQKYLVRDIVHVLKVTVKLRYYQKDYIQEFMGESVSFLLRNAPVEQLRKGIRKIMFEVMRKPLEMRISGGSALLFYIMRGTSLNLHSRAGQVLGLLMDKSTFAIGDKLTEGSDIVVQVVIATFQRLCEELEPTELNLMWDCLYAEVKAAVTDGYSLHLIHLLSLLVSTLQRNYARKLSDYQPVLDLVALLFQTYIKDCDMVMVGDRSSEIISKVLQLMLCILDGLNCSGNMTAVARVSLEWASVFEMRNLSLLTFMKELLLRDPCILHTFRINIIRALNGLIETFKEEVIYLLLIFTERLQGKYSNALDGAPGEGLSRIRHVFQEATSNWIRLISDVIHGKSSCIQFEKTNLALLWGIVSSYPSMVDAQSNPSLLMDLVDALDRLLITDSENIAGLPRSIWTSLIGCCLSSYYKLHFGLQIGYKESSVSKVLNLAKRYKSSLHILSTVADFLDSMDKSTAQLNNGCGKFHPELESGKAVDAFTIFAENLCHPDKRIRHSTLRILCHFESLTFEKNSKDQTTEKKRKREVSETIHEDRGSNVLHLLLSIEETPLSIATSRKIILLISRIQMDLSAARISERYVTVLLYGIIGIFHNRFSYLWKPAVECLAVIISQYFGTVWERYIQYVEGCQSIFLASQDQSKRGITEPSSELHDLVRHFDLFVSPPLDGTPCATVLSLLIQSLQKVSTVSESRSREIIPLFLRFLGYNNDDLVSVKSYNSQVCNGKEWKGVLGDWLNLLKLMRNSRSFYRGPFLKEVLQYRLLDENDAELQMNALDCLLNWRDDFLLPYEQHLKNLITAKKMREELTTWSLSRESNLIDERHRSQIIPIVLQVLVPKVRKLKTLASRKNASIHQRKAVLGFLAELDVGELPLFFALLINPLQIISSECSKDEFDSCNILQNFTTDNIKTLSWKKLYGFLHVVEDILGVFDQLHINPFLDLLMGCVVRILASCSSSLVCTDSIDGNIEQFKNLRSLCLKILPFVLAKYDNHDFGSEFWDLFFTSVKPLVDNFKQEASSSEKPSSLFSCFIAMSRSEKLVSLLSREKNLVHDIFSILTVSRASDAIVSCVLKFIENLLKLDDEQQSDDTAVKRVLLTNIDGLVSSLHSLFTCKSSANRKLVKSPGERELSVFKLLSKYIKDPSAARIFVDILIPLLTKRAQSSDAHVETLRVIQHIIQALGSESTGKILNTVSPLLISAGPDVRVSICDLLKTHSLNDSSLLSVANLLCELNATSTSEMGGLDYETVIGAYDKINKDVFHNIREEHALVLLSHFVHDMSSEELILRQSAYRLMVLFVEFSGQILDQDVKSEKGYWSVASIQHIINKFLLKYMGDAMNKEASVQKVWIDLLREMVLRLSMVPSLKSFRALCSKDAEQDFFNNIVHLQKHRRARALSRFKGVVSSGSLSQVVIAKVFIPLLFNMLFGVQDGKGEHLRNASLEALAAISGCMDWNAYYELLNRCFREMTIKPDKQKLLLRLICSILDHFHFVGTHSNHEAKDSFGNDVQMTSPAAAELSDIQTWLHKKLLPKIQKLLTSGSDNVNVNISLVALKLLKLLPGDIMELHLPNIVHRVSNFLKSRMESIRDEARSALAACLKELGLEYLQFIVKVMRATLKRGFELHVLGYTLNFILSKCLPNPGPGKLDYCLEELLSVAENDILGDVSEEKEVEKIASKMKETRKNKSFETLKLIAQNITFRTHALKLLSPVTAHLQKHLTPKVKLNLGNMLNHIAAGIECNPSIDQTDLFIFSYRLIKDGLNNENQKVEGSQSQQYGDKGSEISTSQMLVYADSQSSHLISVFALEILHNHMRNVKLNKNEETLLSMLDPFVELLGDCLSSKYDDIISATLRCLSLLVRLPLPSLQSQADKIKTSLLVIAQGSVNANSLLMQSCIRLLTVLLRSTSITLSSDHLHMLIQFPLFVDLERNPSVLALSLLKAIIGKKLVVHEIYDIVTQVAELMVTSQAEPIRKKCSQILLQFLLDYRLSAKRLQQHLDFLLANLRYQHSSGREAVLEMLHAIIIKFPPSVVDEQAQAVFVHLVVCLTNDQDQKVRSMTGAAIKLLIGRVTQHRLDSIFEYSVSWYEGGKQQQHLWSTAAQVLGLLVEVMMKGFQRHLNRVLPVIRRILQLAVNAVKDPQLDISNQAAIPFWKEAYYSLVMLEKILQQFPELCLGKDHEDIWETICEFLLHPHMWLRNISNRLIAFYFSRVTEACQENHAKSFETFFLMRPSRLFLVAVSLCCQLKAPLTDDMANLMIGQNIVFAICGLHSLLRQNDYVKFWSTLENHEQGLLLRIFHLLDPRKGKSMFASLTNVNEQNGQENSEGRSSLLVSYLLKRLGKIVLQMEAIQMKIVFNTFRSISAKVFDQGELSSEIGEDDNESYAYQMLVPLYKVCEGFSGKVIPDDVKQLAQEVCESISSTIGSKNFVQIYSQIRKHLKAKREKRRQGEKIMAVVNPERNAKRKLRIAAKHRANKKRKIMTMKMGRWVK